MKIFKTLFLASVALPAMAFFTPKADAGVGFSFSIGSGGYHHHSSAAFIYSAPCYPHSVYYRDPCYRPYTYYRPYPYYSERVVYVEPSPQVIVQQPTYTSEAPAVSASYDSSFYKLGHDWAKDLRDDVISRDQLVSYLKSHLVKASTADYKEFRRGFISAYGSNGEASFDKAYQLARGDS